MKLEDRRKKWINNCITKFGNKYNYDDSIFTSTHGKINIVCNSHGEFIQIAKNHLRYGAGCCCAEQFNLNEFVKWYIKSNLKHNYKFNYSKSIWKGANSKITITCPTHGDFEQWASGHLKHGCERCANFSKSLPYDEFLQKANLKHLNKYIYDENNYNSIKKKTEKLKIHCPDHGDFYQDIAGHVYVGNGCMSCWKGHVSKMEGEWLDYLQVPIKNRNKSLRVNGKLLYPDGFIKETNTVYEFHGDRWHGNPLLYNYMDKNPVSKKTYGVLYANTMEREKLIRDAGYILIVIWENEWKELRKQTYFI